MNFLFSLSGGAGQNELRLQIVAGAINLSGTVTNAHSGVNEHRAVGGGLISGSLIRGGFGGN
jgi:hypothetical protein